jgi:hypothetical protein
MSILKSLKSVPEGLKPRVCERTKLREPLPVPYVPTKDEVQEEVCCKLLINVPYIRTFGVPDQGQMLDM